MGTKLTAHGPPPSGAFWTYWSASTISGVGSAVSSVALPLVAVSVLHAPAFQIGVLAAAPYVAWLVIGLPAGVIVGRLPLRETQVAMDLVRALALASIPLVWWAGFLTLTQLVVTGLVVGFANVLFDVGIMTLLPAIVPKEQLNARNSLMSATHATTQLGGPSLGGLLVQLLGAAPAVAVDAGSYVMSAVFIGRLPPGEVAQPATTRLAVGTMIRQGWRFVVRHPLMGPCMWAATAVNFVCGALIALGPLYLVRVLHTPPGLVGVLIAAEGVGSVPGAIMTPRLSRAVGTARAMLLAGLFGAACALLMPVGQGATGMLLFGAGNAGFATGVVVLSINMRTYRQTESPPELLPRVIATVRFVSWGAIPVGSLTAGAVATVLGAHAALWLTCAAAFLPVVVLWLSPVGSRRDLAGATGAQMMAGKATRPVGARRRRRNRTAPGGRTGWPARRLPARHD